MDDEYLSPGGLSVHALIDGSRRFLDQELADPRRTLQLRTGGDDNFESINAEVPWIEFMEHPGQVRTIFNCRVSLQLRCLRRRPFTACARTSRSATCPGHRGTASYSQTSEV